MNLKKKIAAIGTGLSVAAGNAFAAVPADVTTALADAKTDSLVVAAAVLGIVIAVAAFRFMKGAAR